MTIKSIVSEPKTIQSLCKLALEVILTEDPIKKVEKARSLGELWRGGELEVGSCEPCFEPPRAGNITIVDPRNVPKFGKAGSLKSRINILHSIANVEQWAIDVALDNIVRFSQHESQLPKEYFDDFIKMALDESKHFTWLNSRLHELGSFYGQLPIHKGIWDSAANTKRNLLSRMAIVHMVHEARGLDVNPRTIENFRKNKDFQSSDMLQKIYEDEITHVEIGQRWFSYLCRFYSFDRTIAFKKIVKEYFEGDLKPPFNVPARTLAGMEPEWYENTE